MSKVIGLIKENVPMLSGLIVGAVGGFLYWKLIGCNSGSCPITSSPIMSSVWGAIMGGLLFGSFKKKKKKTKYIKNEENSNRTVICKSWTCSVQRTNQ